MRLEIYELGRTCFLTAPELAWQTSLKINKVKLDLLTDIDMLLMVEKCITGGISHAIHRYVKSTACKIMKKIKNPRILRIKM